MSNIPKLPKGTRDFYPENQRIQNFIFDSWKKTCNSYGYEEYEGPIFEHLDLFTRKSGEEIISQLYAFQDKGGRDIALRPEMTQSLARMVNQKGNTLKKPFKWFSIPRLYRYERAQKGRLREFYQLNMDIIGTESLNAEVDLLSSIVSLLQAFGLGDDDFQIGISSRKLLNALLVQREIKDINQVYAALDKRAKIGEEKFHDLLKENGVLDADIEFLNKFMQSKNITEIKGFCESEDAETALNELIYIFEMFEKMGLKKYLEIDLTVVRGLAYYTGVVFEVFDKQKSMRAIAGGGRYDDLCSMLGGQATTGVGFGVGDVVLGNLLEEKGLLKDASKGMIDFYLVSFEDAPIKLFTLAQQIRAKGYTCSHPLAFQKFKKQLDAANASGAQKVVFVGSEKAGAGEIEVKDFATGEQSVVKLEEL
ncbi:MAG: histidine--tRNA ligase [Fibrobacterales bacterium]